MLEFFRKNQKVFFIITAVIIIVSFSFFGTYSALAGQKEKRAEIPSKEIGLLVDGSPMMSKDVILMKRFLKNGLEESLLLQSHQTPNLLCDSVLHKDFMATGLGAMLLTRYLEVARPDLEKKLSHMQRYLPYVHAGAPSISQEDIWKRLGSSMPAYLKELKKGGAGVTEQQVSLLGRLYAEQISVPPELVKNALLFQEHHYAHGHQDPYLHGASLALFGYSSIEDWFGPSFLDLASQFILNAAAFAKEKGITISQETAKCSLIENIAMGLQKMKQPTTHAVRVLQSQLAMLEMSEEEAVQTWEKILLFRTLFGGVGEGVFLDPNGYENVLSFGAKKAHIVAYTLPQSLNLNSYVDLLQLQLYLEKTGLDSKQVLSLPSQIEDVATVAKKAPELIGSEMTVNIATADKKDAMQELSLREVWDWELADENWIAICKSIPLLSDKKEAPSNSRIALLEGLDKAARERIDTLASMELIAQKPELIARALEKKKGETQTFFLQRGKDLPIAGLEKEKRIAELLQDATLAEEEKNASAQELAHFSPDQKSYYSIEVTERKAPQVLSFSAARKEKILEKMVREKLGSAEDQEALAKEILSPFIKGSVKNFLSSLAIQYKKSIEEGNEDIFAPQFQFDKKSQVVHRFDQDPAATIAFNLKEGEFSSVFQREDGRLAFFQLTRLEDQEDDLEKRVTNGQKLLALDAKRALMQTLLNLFTQKRAIVSVDEGE